MRLFRISFAVFYDPHWRASFRRSWSSRRYWLALPPARALVGRALAVQVGPLTFKFHGQGPDRRSATNG